MDQYFEIAGASLRYRDEGAGPTVLFIHGWTLDLNMWDLQVDSLARKFRILRLDRRGFGLSQGWYAPGRDAEDVVALCRHLDATSIALVGMSQGARIALKAVLAEPSLFTCLILDGPPDQRFGSDSPSNDVPLAEFRALVRTHGISAFRKAWGSHPLSVLTTAGEPARQLLKEILERYQAIDLVGSPGPLAKEEPFALAQIRMPALVINGELDLLSRRTLGKALAQTLPMGEHAYVPQAGHLANLDNPVAYNAILGNFLERHARKHR